MKTISHIKDQLDTLKSLIETCCIALHNVDNQDWEIQKISETLFFVALPLIDEISEGIDD